MKKLISCLLAVMMLVSAAGAIAESADAIITNKAVLKFLNETDYQTKDIAVQIQSEDEVDDVVIRADKDNLHLVTRSGGAEGSHIQLNPTGIYVGSAEKVTLLRYDTIISVVDGFYKELESMLEKSVESAPAEKAPTEEEVKKAVEQLNILAAQAAAQEEADAATLTSAAMSFASKFKPEYILDVKEGDGSVEISLRSEAYASAMADAMDEMMTNPSLAKLVDRQAEGGKTFAEIQQDWLKIREATLETIRTIENKETIEENGHLTSHFQIGDETADEKILVYDTDSWIDAEDDEMEIKTSLGFKDEDPILVYELAVSQYGYREKMTSANSVGDVDINISFDDNRISGGYITTVIEGQEQLKAYFGPDYLYMKGPRGGISTSVRETWTGKYRYELVTENAQGETNVMVLDFFEEDDSLICELSTDKSDRTVQFKISRIDKVTIDDLSASENITEITVEDIQSELGNILKEAIPALGNDAETAK